MDVERSSWKEGGKQETVIKEINIRHTAGIERIMNEITTDHVS